MDDHLHCISELELLTKHISSDLSAIALIDQDNRITWRYMYGNLNERYRHMVKKPGFGLTGQVIRFGRTIIIDKMHTNLEHIHGQLPIMLSEQLLAAVAVPLQNDHRIFGVLLIGDRQERAYTVQEVQYIEQSRERILPFIPTEHIHTVSNGILEK